MSPKTTAVLTIVFAIVVSLNILGVFDIPVSQNTQIAPIKSPILRPTPTQTPKQTLLPLNQPISIVKEIKEFLSLAPVPTTLLPTPSENEESFKSVKELQQSLNTSLDLNADGIPFGGKVTHIEYCDPYSPPCFCGGAEELINVGPPREGTFAINSQTTIYEFYDWSVGNWVLGLSHFYNDTCFIQIIDPLTFQCLYCQSIGSGPAINIMGTSK